MSNAKLLSELAQKALLKGFNARNGAVAARCMCSWIPKDVPTHTGQQWDEKDYRLARFIDRPKQVNHNFAINLIAEVPPKACKERVVWCDGGGGPTGHPRVFINLDKPGDHSCGYCGLRFFLDHSH